MNIIVHYPSSPDGMKNLQKKAAECHAKLVVDYINNLTLSKSEKEKLLGEVIKLSSQG